MEYCGVFGSSTSQHLCIGYEETPYASATSHFVGGTGTTYVTPQVFAEMPTPSSWHGTDVIAPGYWNYCYVHQSPIQSSSQQGGSTNLREQHLDGMPQPYGFHNLNRQSLFLADGTQRSYYALPENYSLERATSSTSHAMSKSEVSDNYQSFTPPRNDLLSEKQTHPSQETQSIIDILAQAKAKVEAISEKLQYESTGHGCDMILYCTEQKAAPEPLLTRGTMNEFNDMPIYDVYEEDVTACRSCIHPTVHIIAVDTEEVEVKEDSGKPRISRERPTNEKKPDNEGISLCVNKASYNTFSEEAAVIFPHGPVIHADRSIKLTNEKSTQAAPILFVQGATVHCADESSEINVKRQDMLINKHGIFDSKSDVSFLKSGISPCEHPCNLNNDKEELLWDLASVRSTTRCSISCLKFTVREAYPILPCTWDPGIDLFPYKKLHLFTWISLSAIPLLQQLHNKNISYMWEFSLVKGRQVQ